MDDHPIIADSVALALAGSGFIVQAAASADDLRRSLAHDDTSNSLVILDIGLPDADGIHLVSEIHRRHRLPVLVFSGLSGWLTIRACERAGASGFVAKSAKPDALLSGIEAISSGGQFFPASYLNSGKHIAPDVETMSDRQFQVLELIAEGNSNKTIATCLHLAEGTVKNIVTELLQIFHVESRQKLILATHKLGYAVRTYPPEITAA